MPTRAETTNFTEDTQTRGIHMVVYQAWRERPAVGRDVFNVYNSNQYREHILTAGGIGLLDETAEGTSVNYDSPVEGYLSTFTHTKFSRGLRFTEEMWGDDLNGIMEDSPSELGEAAVATEETTLANHFNNGFTTTWADGLPIFDTEHVRENGATYRNMLSTDSDLSVTTLEQALIDFDDFRTGGGRRLNISPACLLIPADLRFTAAKILDSSNMPQVNYGASATSFGDASVNPVSDAGLKTLVWRYLTDTDAWFLLADKKDHKLVCYDRQAFTTSDVVDFDTGDLKFKGVYRQSSGVGDPRAIFGTPGAG